MKDINQEYMVTPDNFKDSDYANKHYDIRDYVRKLSRIEKIIIHCTATDSKKWDDSDGDGNSDPLALIKFDISGNTGNPRLPKNGCPTATYHFYVTKPGNIFQLVSMDIQTMNARNHNRDSVAICINDDGNSSNVSQEQFDGLVEAICHVIDFLDLPYDEVKEYVYFHRDLDPSKLCPGDISKEKLLDEVIKRLQARGDTE